jgi:hypothetical protein
MGRNLFDLFSTRDLVIFFHEPEVFFREPEVSRHDFEVKSGVL